MALRFEANKLIHKDRWNGRRYVSFINDFIYPVLFDIYGGTSANEMIEGARLWCNRRNPKHTTIAEKRRRRKERKSLVINILCNTSTRDLIEYMTKRDFVKMEFARTMIAFRISYHQLDYKINLNYYLSSQVDTQKNKLQSELQKLEDENTPKLFMSEQSGRHLHSLLTKVTA